MRAAVLLVALAAAGCAQPSPEEVRQRDAARAAYLQTPDGKAETICRFKAEAAIAPRKRGTLMDIALVDHELRLQRQCLETFRTTGIMPSY
jgi:hypothetical protein